MRELAVLEKPRGMAKILACLKARYFEITYGDIVEDGMTRWAATQCVRRLVQLGVLVSLRKPQSKVSERWFATTAPGRSFVEAGSALFKAMQRVEGREKPSRLARLPSGSLPILATTVHDGMIWHSEAVRKLGLSRASTTRALQRLRQAGLVKAHASQGFPPRLFYEATKEGRCLGRILLWALPACISASSGRRAKKGEDWTRRRKVRQSALTDFNSKRSQHR